MAYEKYKESCVEKGYKPTMTEKQFNEMMGINNEVVISPLTIRPRNQRPKSATLKTYNDIR